MTEFELAELFMVWATFIETTGEHFITLLFAFLIAAYLVSAKLFRVMVVIVLTLYSYMAIRYTALHFNVSGDIIALAEKIQVSRIQSAGTDLDWLVVGGTAYATQWFTQSAAMLLSYIASIVFFFYTRRYHGRVA